MFKAVVKHYEGKQYKKGIKASENILKKFPNHGETLCMKGLTLNCMGKRDEAHEFVRKGLMKDMRSHVCWHVFGLLHRSDRNYNEAIKAYKQALKIDPQNLQILRDLSLLQIQMRDLNGFVLTRHTILNLKPNNKIHWLAFALAKHLSQDREGSVSVIDIYLGTLTDNAPELRRGFESSELALYRNNVLAEIPNNERVALKHLDECKHLVVDEGAWLQAKAFLHLKLGEFDDAKEFYHALFKRGQTENYPVHSGYMCALLNLEREKCESALKLKGVDTVATTQTLSSEQKALLLDSYKKEVAHINPRSNAMKRIPLTLLEGEPLRDAMDKYCRKDLSKGVPYLAADLHALLLSEEKNGKITRMKDPIDVKSHPTFDIMVHLVDGYIDSLLSSAKFPGQKEEESPSTILWTWYLRACLHEFAGEYVEGLEVLEKCLVHTPTAVDVYERKARLLKLSGVIEGAAECLDVGRELDKQDRYINNKTTKYLLRANRDEDARNRISLFTRHEGNPEQNLFDMQCTWYELELAACLTRKGEWGKSLKKYVAVEKHFEDFHEDQFDFHSYCIRKVTLRAYVDVLRWEDDLWSQKCYGRAAEGIINCYLHLYDNPKDALTGDEEPDYSNMNAAQKKKAKNIYRKKKKAAEKRAAEKEEQKKTEGNLNGDKKNKTKTEVVDEDPNGDVLLKRNPLDQAKKYISTLVKNAPNRFATWILQYDVAVRRGKKMMALQALFKAKSIDPSNSELFQRSVDFAFNIHIRNDDSCDSVVSEILTSETATLLGGKSVEDYVSENYTSVKNDNLTDLPMRLAVAKASVLTKTASIVDVASLITIEGLKGRKVSVANCRKAIEFLNSLGEDAHGVKSCWISKVKEKYPLVNNFD